MVEPVVRLVVWGVVKLARWRRVLRLEQEDDRHVRDLPCSVLLAETIQLD